MSFNILYESYKKMVVAEQAAMFGQLKARCTWCQEEFRSKLEKYLACTPGTNENDVCHQLFLKLKEEYNG